MKKQTKLIFSLLIIVVLIIVAVIFLTKDPSTVVSIDTKSADKNLLIGDWVRTDASYLIKIAKVNKDKTLAAQYFNPNPINVGKASWEESYGNLKITIELRDVNYPGSTYTLNYLPDRDILAGEYYQAVEGITFYVEFTRRH
jgi:uncharacterized membrane protein